MINLSIESVSKTKQEQMKEAMLASVENRTALCQYAVLTAVRNATDKAIDMVQTYVANEFQLSPDVPVIVADGKNFVHQGYVFRIGTKCDYNYAANDDLPTDDGKNIQALIAEQDALKAQMKLLTERINVRKKMIKQAHPRMLPIAGSVKYVVAFLGMEGEA